MRRTLFIVALSSSLSPALAGAAEEQIAPRPDCDSRPNAYMRVECRVIVDPAFDQKWRRMTPSEMQDAVDADPCVGFFSAELERQCRDKAKKTTK